MWLFSEFKDTITYFFCKMFFVEKRVKFMQELFKSSQSTVRTESCFMIVELQLVVIIEEQIVP